MWFNTLLEMPIPRNIVIAWLMTRRYVDSLIQHRDREMCLAALWVITGFLQVPVAVNKLNRGESAYTFRTTRVSSHQPAITSFSNRPLVYIFYLGGAIVLISIKVRYV